jgi:hypothetical protein
MRHRLRLAAFVGTLALSAAVTGAAQELPPPPPLTVSDFFDDQVLHSIRLVINPRDWQELKANFQLNTYYPCHFIWRNQIVRNVAIRSRGTGSRSGSKPGLRIDFNLFDEYQQFLGLKSVVLRNNVQDATNLHERVGMQFFTRLGLAAPREAHTRLYVNDEYAGLYSIVESIDKVFLATRYGQDNGYLYEYDYDVDDQPYRFEYKGPEPSLYSPKPFKPVTHELDPDSRPLAQMIRAIKETRNTEFASVMSRYLDLRQLVIHAAIENFLSEIDGVLGEWGMNNFYLYRFEGTTVNTIVPWDKSEAFKGGISHSIWHNIDDVPSWIQNVLMTRTMLVPELRRLYLDALRRCAEIASATEDPVAENEMIDEVDGQAGDRPGWLEREIRRAYEQVREAALEDTAKPYSNDEFEEDVQRMIQFARERSAFVLNDVERSPR